MAKQSLRLSDHDLRILSSVGHGAYGKELIQILTKVKDQLCSIDGIERGSGNYGEQVEGRLIFKDFAIELIACLNFEKRSHMRPEDMDRDNYE